MAVITCPSPGRRDVLWSVCYYDSPLAYLRNHVHISQRFLHMLPVAWSFDECNTLCISCFVDDITFSHNAVNGPESKTTLFRRVGGNGGEVAVCNCRLVAYCNVCDLLRLVHVSQLPSAAATDFTHSSTTPSVWNGINTVTRLNMHLVKHTNQTITCIIQHIPMHRAALTTLRTNGNVNTINTKRLRPLIRNN